MSGFTGLLGLFAIWLLASAFYYGKYSDIFKGGGDGWGYDPFNSPHLSLYDWESLDYIVQKKKKN